MPGYFTITVTFVLIFTIKLIESNRWGGGGHSGGGNRGNNGNNNRWKQVGGGGFNSWRQQQFKHNFNSNHHNYQHQSFNNNKNSESDNGNTGAQVPGISFAHTPSETSCAIPTMGDSSKFELRCIFPTSDEDADCLSAGSYLPSGTSAMLRCKPPYVSETGELRIWVCEEGIWKGEFKSFSCTHPPVYTNTWNNNAGNNAAQNNGNGYTNNNYNSNNNRPTGNSWGQQQQTKEQGTQTDSANLNGWAQQQTKEQGTQTDWQPTLISNLIPGLLDQRNSNSASDDIPENYPTDSTQDTVQPPWLPALEKWKPHSTTTTTTTRPITTTTRPTTTTTRRTTTTRPTTTTTTTTTSKPSPYLPPPQKEPEDWNSYFHQNKENSSKSPKCPSLFKGTGIQLECLSKVPVPWDPSSFVVTQSNCSSAQPIGTEATYKCEQYYEASVGLTLQYRKCKVDGTWTGGETRFSCALECGKSNPVGRTPLITRGEPTYKAQWPWHASLFFQDTRKEQTQYEYNCGATLINRKVVLTAAHCVTEYYSKSLRTLNQFRVDLGRYERTVEDEFVQTFSADEIITHPSYNPVTFDSDIAIIILKGSASVGFHVRPICYPQTQNSAFEEIHLSDGSLGTVVGFGKNEDGNLSDILHMARLKVVSQEECSENFSDTNFGASLTKSTTFCAGLKNGTNVCSGDSGGGIYFPVSSGGVSRWYLQGLVSVGITAQDGSNRCDPTRFSVFTKISPYADWILRVLSEKDAL